MTPAERDVIAAALEWWEGRKPEVWTKGNHIDHPEVNCVTARERLLARCCARLVVKLKAKRKV